MHLLPPESNKGGILSNMGLGFQSEHYIPDFYILKTGRNPTSLHVWQNFPSPNFKKVEWFGETSRSQISRQIKISILY